MKRIQKEITTYKDIFVSIDGKEFNSEADCRQWESSYRGTLEASWKNVKKLEVDTCSLGLPWSSDDYECYVIKPKNLEEITLINAYILSSTDNGATALTTQHIGELIALNFGYDHDYCDVYVLSDHIKKVTDYIAKLGNEIDENEEE